MSDIKKNLNNIFTKSIAITESQNEEINETFWDDVKGEWKKGKEIAKSPVKHLVNKLGNKIFNKIGKKDTVQGTGEIKKKPITHTPSTPPIQPSTSPNSNFGGNTKSTLPPPPAATKASPAPSKTPAVKQVALPTLPIQLPPLPNAPASTTPSPSPVATSPANKVSLPVLPTPGNNTPSNTPVIDVNKPQVILNANGIELEDGIEDARQKEKKIINPLRNQLQKKIKEFGNNIDKIKRKNGITSENSVDDIANKPSTDPVRKLIIRNLFADKFYSSAYENMLENLRKMNIISENRIDYGTFNQCFNNAIEKAKITHERRFANSIKKIKNVKDNEADVRNGMQKGIASFKRDINNIYKSNKDMFTMPKMQEGCENTFFNFYFMEGVITEADPETSDPNNQKQAEDTKIRINDYVWWIDGTEIEKILTDPKLRSQLKYHNQNIDFTPDANGKLFDGTSANIIIKDGTNKGHKEKIDIRNLDVPQNIAKSIIKFGRVIGDVSQQKQLADIDAEMQQAKDDLDRMTRVISPDQDKINKQREYIRRIENTRKLALSTISFSHAKVQLFRAKDPNSFDKTLSGGKTLITPDDKNTQPVEVSVKELVKLSTPSGKQKLLSVIGKTAITFGVITGFISGEYLHSLLSGIEKSLSGVADRLGDIAGSRPTSISSNF